MKIYDTTLRDGTQGEGVSFSVEDKLMIARRLDELGVDYIEGGWPGSNVKDEEFFERARSLDLGHAPLAAFGSTCHPRNHAEDDPDLKALIEAQTPVVTIFGKTCDEGLEKGVRVRVSSITKFHSRMMPTTAKARGTYVNSMLAVLEAMAAGYDEALLLDEHGNVAEGSSENLFIVTGDHLLTNDERSSILMGITRDVVIKIARDLGYRVNIGMIRPGDLYQADEAFFTGTAAEVTPIRELNGMQIGGARGP